VLSSTYQSTAHLLLSSLYEPLTKHLISVLGSPATLQFLAAGIAKKRGTRK